MSPYGISYYGKNRSFSAVTTITGYWVTDYPAIRILGKRLLMPVFNNVAFRRRKIKFQTGTGFAIIYVGE